MTITPSSETIKQQRASALADTAADERGLDRSSMNAAADSCELPTVTSTDGQSSSCSYSSSQRFSEMYRALPSAFLL